MTGPPIRYGILGPLDVFVGDQRLAIVGPRIQAVLATLILQGGSELSADALIDVVWGDSPPPTVRTSLQVHISRLRSCLADAGVRDVLLTRGSAYLLKMEVDQLDAAIFRTSIEEARLQLGQGANEKALGLLEEALGLWRGAPLLGVDLPGLPPGSLRELEDMRDLAVVLRSEAELSLGRHAEALPNILRARAELPLDERVCELAALALYRSGRQADALAEIAGLRRDLSEQLGMEPGASIAELERKILAADPELDPSVRETAETREVRKTISVVALRLPGGDPEDVLASTGAVSDLFQGAVLNLNGWCPPARSGRLLGIFGLPVVHEDDAERAVRTADVLRRASSALGLDVRLGVSTGDVLALVGDDMALLTHDPIEVADLLARKARPGEVLLGVATRRLVGSVASFDPAQLLVIDDGDAPLLAHRLRDVADSQAAPRLTAALVGREHELLRMSEAAQRAFAERQPTMLAVLGPAGIGKSRLINAFTAGLGDRVDVAPGRCLPYGRDVGLAPIAEIVRRVAGIGDTRAMASARRRLESFVSEEPDREALADLLASLVGISDGSSKRDETFWAVRRCFEIAASIQPLTVVLEDLQWAEAPLLDLIGYVASTVSQAPLVLACSARPDTDERRPSWGGVGSDAVTIRLDPLSSSEMDELLTEFLGAGELDPEAKERIIAAAEGNPLFLEEVLSVLIDDGHLRRRGKRWEAVGDLSVVPIPPTVKALLDARVDLLSPSERDVLEAASVVGREFTVDDVADLRPAIEADQLAASLDSLSRRGLVDLHRFANRGTVAYAFRHLAIRDVAYSAVPRERRAGDHERYARALIDRAGERRPDLDEVAGFHLETAYHLLCQPAGDSAEWQALGSLAAGHLAAAGRRAFSLDDATAAANLFARAMHCIVHDDSVRAELARLRGAALFDLGRFDEAREVLQVALLAVRESSEESLVWRLELELMELDIYTRPGKRGARQTQDFAESAIAALKELGDTAGLARSYRLLGEALTLQGRLDEGIAAFEHGSELAREAGDEREIALPQQLMALHGTMPLPLFVAHCEQLIANRSRRPRPEIVMRLAYARSLMGESGEARVHLEEGLGLAREVGGAFRVADAELYAGLTLLALGEPLQATALLESSMDRLTQIGESNLRSTVAGFLGEGRYRLGQLGEAEHATRMCRELSAKDDWVSQLLWRQVSAKTCAAGGDYGTARTLILEAVAIADKTDFLTISASVHIDAATILSLVGDDLAADRERTRARQLQARKGIAEHVLQGALDIA